MLAEAVEAGLGIFVGAVPATPVPAARAAAPASRGPTAPRPPLLLRNGTVRRAHAPPPQRVVELWRRMGWPAARSPVLKDSAAGIAAQVVITPACGLAGAPPEYARAALACCREAARMLPELIEEEAP